MVSTDVLGDSIAAVGLMIAFYYGLTGFACVWYYRHDLGNSAGDLLKKGIMPGLGGLMLLSAFVIAATQYADPEYGSTTLFGVGGVFIIGIGALLLGVVIMIGWNLAAPAFFRGETLPKRGAPALVLLTPEMETETLRLPDSGLPAMVVAPDLSNLPEGATAVDVETGEAMHLDEDGDVVEGFASAEQEEVFDHLVEDGTLHETEGHEHGVHGPGPARGADGAGTTPDPSDGGRQDG
jgi:hypothetical protein